MTPSSSSSIREPFRSVAGHGDSIFYGPQTRDHQTTLEKASTAWEVLWYSGMFIATHLPDGDELISMVWPNGEAAPPACLQFLRALRGLSNFTPTLFSVTFPPRESLSTQLQRAIEECSLGCDDDNRPRLDLHREHKALPVLARLFKCLYNSMDLLPQTFHADYDSTTWTIGLLDETSGMNQPCAMDIKIGYMRHSPYTTAPTKAQRLMEKDKGALVSRCALRLCGMRRYVCPSSCFAEQSMNQAGNGVATTASSCEVKEEENSDGSTCGETDTRRDSAIDLTSQTPLCISLMEEFHDKSLGYGLTCEEELRTAVFAFFSSEGSMQSWLKNTVQTQNTATCVGEMERRRSARERVQHMLTFFRDTEDGQFLLERMAFVSSSVLCIYDPTRNAGSPASASRAPPLCEPSTSEACNLRLIDFSRCSPRHLNFDEPQLGFVRGLENLSMLLETSSPIARKEN